MSKAFRCNRCGYYGEFPNGASLRDIGWDENQTIDLCLECKDDFQRFMQGYQVSTYKQIDILQKRDKVESVPKKRIIKKSGRYPWHIEKEIK